MIIQTYYISTGKKNAMYTLRCSRTSTEVSAGVDLFFPDFYVCNLAVDEGRAIEKAQAYFEAASQHCPETSDFRMEFDASPERVADQRRGKLSINDTRKLRKIEAGIFPFGKHVDTSIEAAPDSYLLFFADKTRDATLDVVMSALASACMGVALSRGLIAKREAARAERVELDAKSNYVGAIGERREFSGLVISAFEKGFTADGQFVCEFVVNKLRCGDDIVVYMGKKLADVGMQITIKATIKKHSEYNGVKSTQVNRPIVCDPK